MTTITSVRAGSQKVPVGVGFGLDLKRAWGTVTTSTAFVAGDVLQMVKLPKGAVIVGGALKGDKIDSSASGSACLTVNIGTDKTLVTVFAGTSVSTSSTTLALASAWALGPDAAAVTGYKPDTDVRNMPLGGLLLTDGPLRTTDDCFGIITIKTSALAVTTGEITLEIDYYMETQS